MTVGLGIDTGGTYTDAVLVDYESGRVLASAKALTTRHDPAEGISAAIDGVFRARPSIRPTDVGLVGLSTTLATNAIVEGHGSPVCLILIGYDPRILDKYKLKEELVADHVVHIRGGHNILGNEACPLDGAALRAAALEAVRDWGTRVFAVSGYFSVLNPSHELRAKALIEELTGLPVTCGHELTSRLDSVRRATTVALNARIIPLLRNLIETLQASLYARHIDAPLMIVKGDGSLVRAEWARQRPVETILSGPAASMVGAWHLAQLGEQDGGTPNVWAIDMGGTTSDIAAIREGRPRLNPEGAQVGRWRTMVEAIDVHTVALGGDSHVRVNDRSEIETGPDRVVPLCRLAAEHPQVLEDLGAQAKAGCNNGLAARFLLAGSPPGRALQAGEKALLEALSHGPRSLAEWAPSAGTSSEVLRNVERLAGEWLVLAAGFTPTDALHALGRLALWEREASWLAAGILAAQLGSDAQSLCNRVVAGVVRRAEHAILESARAEPAPTVSVLEDPLVAIGAPVEAYLPEVARHLHTRLIIPPHAAVANAVGAIVGSVVQTRHVTISALNKETLRLYLPDGVHDFAHLEEAVDFARRKMIPEIVLLCQEAGAAQVEVQMSRQDQGALLQTGWAEAVYLGTELVFTGAGRPSVAR